MSSYTALLQQLQTSGQLRISTPKTDRHHRFSPRERAVKVARPSLPHDGPRPATSTAGWNLELRTSASSMPFMATGDGLLRTPRQPAWWRSSVDRSEGGTARQLTSRGSSRGSTRSLRAVAVPSPRDAPLTTEALGDISSLRARTPRSGQRSARQSKGDTPQERGGSGRRPSPPGSARKASPGEERQTGPQRSGSKGAAGGSTPVWRPNSGRSLDASRSPGAARGSSRGGRRTRKPTDESALARGHASARGSGSETASPTAETPPRTPERLLVHRRTPVNRMAYVEGDLRAPALLTRLWPGRSRTARSAEGDPVKPSSISSAFGGFPAFTNATVPDGKAGAGAEPFAYRSDRAGLGLGDTLNTIASENWSEAADSSVYDPAGGGGVSAQSSRDGLFNTQSLLLDSRASIGQSRLKIEYDEVRRLVAPPPGKEGRVRVPPELLDEAITRMKPLLEKARASVEKRGKYTDRAQDAYGVDPEDLTPSPAALTLAKLLRFSAALAAAKGDQEQAGFYAEEALIYVPANTSAHYRRGMSQVSKELPMQAAFSFHAGLQSEPSNSNLATELQRAVTAVGHSRQQRQRARTPPTIYPEWSKPDVRAHTPRLLSIRAVTFAHPWAFRRQLTRCT